MKRGQAALEFLTNYGWVLVAIMVCTGTLFGFGVINPKMWKNTKCWADAGIHCKDAYNYQTTDITGTRQHTALILYNNFRQDVEVKSATWTVSTKRGTCPLANCSTPGLCNLATSATWTPGSKRTFITPDCNALINSTWADVTATITYRTDLGNKYDKTATVNAEIKLVAGGSGSNTGFMGS